MDMSQEKPGGSKNKWLLGLGIGCGALVIIVIVVFVGGYFLIKNMTLGFKESESKLSELTARYGRVEDYRPDPAGAIGPDRLEIFLKARDMAAPSRRKLEVSFEQLTRDGKSFAAIRRGLGLIPLVADYFKARSQSLLDAGMGMGEYYFIYVVVYESWLKKPLEDGPGVRITEGGGFRMDWDGEDTKEFQKDFALRRVRQFMLPILRNQLAQLASGGETGDMRTGREAAIPWREKLASEIAALEADAHRLPWQAGLPEVLETSLRPFRERLEASYSPMINLFEIYLEQK
jgi:hypothetical protein